MKYCTHCGAEMLDDAVVCVKCGCSVKPPAKKDDTMKLIVKIFMILGCISFGWALIPLAWCIPMTVSAGEGILMPLSPTLSTRYENSLRSSGIVASR